MEPNIIKLDNGRTIVADEDGAPILISLATRNATTSPTRLKMVLGVTLEDEDGEAVLAALPFSGQTPEFRFELN